MIEPASYREAIRSLNSKEWQAAMDDEYKSLIKNNTWTLVKRPKEHNVIKCRWVFRLKRNQNGAVDRYKARLVAEGFSQVSGIDYQEKSHR